MTVIKKRPNSTFISLIWKKIYWRGKDVCQAKICLDFNIMKVSISIMCYYNSNSIQLYSGNNSQIIVFTVKYYSTFKLKIS